MSDRLKGEFRPTPFVVEQAADLGYDIDVLLAIAEQPVSTYVANNVTHALAREPGESGRYFLIGSHEEEDGSRELAGAWLLRSDFVERVGADSPLLILQEFAQEVGEVIQVGNQRNRFIFAESIPIADPEGRIELDDLAHIVGEVRRGRYFHHLEVGGRREGSRVIADVRYGYAIERTRYLDWLRDDPRPIVDYSSVFISYGEPDAAFALKLRDELTRYGVDCWLYPLDETYGRRSWEEITDEIHQRERIIILCSAAALVREGSLKEIETAVDHNPDKIICVSLDTLWHAPGFRILRGTRDLKPYLMDRNYADFTRKRHFGEQARKLLKALEKPLA